MALSSVSVHLNFTFEEMLVDHPKKSSVVFFRRHVNRHPTALVSVPDCTIGGNYGPESSLHCVKGFDVVGGRVR